MSTDETPPEYTAVVCPVCRTRTDARIRDSASTVDCPDCFTPVRVPSRDELIAMQPKAIEVADPGAYSIAAEPVHPREESRREEVAKAETVAVFCPHCRSRLTPELYDRRRNITCPDCLEVFEVPTQKEWRKTHKPPRKRPIADPSPYNLSADPVEQTAAVTPPVSSAPQTEPLAKPFEAMADVRRAAPVFVPDWTFFSRVFSLPWRADGLRCWIQFSMGCTALGLLAATLNWLVGSGMIVVVPFFALPAIWVMFWVTSYGISSGMTILEQTANGRDEITEWNDGGWSSWMTDSFAPGFLAMVSWMFAFYTTKLITLAAGDAVLWPTASVLFVLLFPVVLMSSMEAGSAFVPLTWPVLRTLGRNAFLWLAYFTLAVVVASVYFLPVYFGLGKGSWFLTLGLTGPLLAAVVMIEARLLGRLAWKAIVFQGAKRRRKKKRNGNAETTRRQDFNDLPNGGELVIPISRG